jgi:hypothetical protein
MGYKRKKTVANKTSGTKRGRPKGSRNKRPIKEKLNAKKRITPSGIIEEISRIAYQDKRTFYDDDNVPIPLDQLTDSQQSAIKDILFKSINAIDDKGNEVKKLVVSAYRFYNKMDALKMLAYNVGLYIDKINPAPKIDEDELAKKAGSNNKPQNIESLMRKLSISQLDQLNEISKAISDDDGIDAKIISIGNRGKK